MSSQIYSGLSQNKLNPKQTLARNHAVTAVRSYSDSDSNMVTAGDNDHFDSPTTQEGNQGQTATLTGAEAPFQLPEGQLLDTTETHANAPGAPAASGNAGASGDTAAATASNAGQNNIYNEASTNEPAGSAPSNMAASTAPSNGAASTNDNASGDQDSPGNYSNATLLKAALAPLMAELVQLRHSVATTASESQALHNEAMKAVNQLSTKFVDIEKAFVSSYATSPMFQGQAFQDASTVVVSHQADGSGTQASDELDLTNRRLDDQFKNESTRATNDRTPSGKNHDTKTPAAHINTPNTVLIDRSDLSAVVKTEMTTHSSQSNAGGGVITYKQLNNVPSPFSGRDEDFSNFRVLLEECAELNGLGWALRVDGKHCSSGEHKEALEVYEEKSKVMIDGKSKAKHDQTRLYILISSLLPKSGVSLRKVCKVHDEFAGTKIFDALVTKYLPHNAQLRRRTKKEFEDVCYAPLNEGWQKRWEKIREHLDQLESLDCIPDETEAVQIVVDGMRESVHEHWRSYAVHLDYQPDPPKTLDDLNLVCREHELKWKKRKVNGQAAHAAEGSKYCSKHGPNSTHTTAECKALKKEKEKADSAKSSKKDDNKQRDANKQRNKFCSKHGNNATHTTDECRVLKKAQENKSGGKQAVSNKKGDVDVTDYTCFRCGVKGHLRTDCPNKESANVIESNKETVNYAAISRIPCSEHSLAETIAAHPPKASKKRRFRCRRPNHNRQRVKTRTVCTQTSAEDTTTAESTVTWETALVPIDRIRWIMDTIREAIEACADSATLQALYRQYICDAKVNAEAQIYDYYQALSKSHADTTTDLNCAFSYEGVDISGDVKFAIWQQYDYPGVFGHDFKASFYLYGIPDYISMGDFSLNDEANRDLLQDLHKAYNGAYARVHDYYAELRKAHLTDSSNAARSSLGDDDQSDAYDDFCGDSYDSVIDDTTGDACQNDNDDGAQHIPSAFMARVVDEVHDDDDYTHDDDAAEIVLLVDSGCTITIVSDARLLQDYMTDQTPIQTASNKKGALRAEGSGTLALTFLSVDGTMVQAHMPSLHCPNARRSLLSVSALVCAGWTCSLTDGPSFITSPEGKIVNLDRDSSEGSTALWTIKGCIIEPTVRHYALTAESALAALTDEMQWHLRLGHINFTDLVDGCSRLKNGPKKPLIVPTNGIACHDCVRGKMRRAGPGLLSIDADATLPLELLHLDLSGPMRKTSILGSLYSLIIVDSHSHFKWDLPLEKKSDVPSVLRAFIVKIHATTRYKIKRIHSDQGTEFTSAAFGLLCLEFNISLSTSTVYEPRGNGVAERAIQTLTTLARTMLITSNAPLYLWAHSRIYAAEVTNAIAMGGRTYSPHELLYQQQADASILYPFGCWCQVYHPRRLLPDPKWSIAGEEGIYIGTASYANQRGFAVYLKTGRVVFSVSVRIDSTFFPYRQRGQQRITATFFEDTDMDKDTHATWPGTDAPLLDADRVFIPPSELDGDQPPDHVDTEDQLLGLSSSITLEGGDTDCRPSLLRRYGHQIDHQAASKGATSHISAPVADAYDLTTPDGQFAPDLVGRYVKVPFEGKIYEGPIIDTNFDEGSLLFSVKFDNSDSKKWFEIFTWDELQNVLVPLEHEANTLDTETSSDLNILATTTGNDVIPTRTLMLQQPDAESFIEAERVENENMTRHKVWRWAVLPKGKKAIPLKFTYKRKRDKHGVVCKHKARIVAQGFRQVHGIDYFSTAAPVATTMAFRILVAVAVTRGLTLETFDVDGAFLNSEINEEIYVKPTPGMRPPSDFLAANPSGSEDTYVLRLLKTLYGLKQSARAWHHLFKSVLLQMGYRAFDASDCAFVLHEGNSTSMLVLHVDDVAHAHNSEELSNRLKDRLRSLWGLSGEGKLDYFLGMQVEYVKGQYARIWQRTYLEGVLRRFDMLDSHPKGTPMETSVKISKADSHAEADHKVKTQYQQMLGSLLFACVMTRPDIANACSQLGRVMSAPSNSHLSSLKRVMRYIAGTLDYGIKFENRAWTAPGTTSPVSPLTLVTFSDSDWASNVDDRSSTTGYIVMLAGGPISWKSKGQHSIALSSAEAEYVAMSAASKDTIYARNVLKELGIHDVSQPTKIYTDSTAALSIATSSGINDRTKHIQLRHHYLRSLVNSGEITIEKVLTDMNPADHFTKALPKDVFEKHRNVFLKTQTPVDIT